MLQKPMHLSMSGHGFVWLALLAIVLVPARGMGAQRGGDENSLVKPYSRVFAGVSVILFSPTQATFREVYRPVIVHPQIRVGYFLSPGAYVFSTFDMFSLNGKTPDWQLDARLSQWSVALGAGYRKDVSGKISLSGAVGAVYLAYQEEIQALAAKNSSGCLGFVVEGALYYQFGKKIRGITCLSYTNAQKTSADITAKFGGFRLGIGALACL